jgi:hypothetical protein
VQIATRTGNKNGNMHVKIRLLVWDTNFIYSKKFTQSLNNTLERKSGRESNLSKFRRKLVPPFSGYRNHVLVKTREAPGKYYQSFLNTNLRTCTPRERRGCNDSLRTGRSRDHMPVGAGFSERLQTVLEVHPAFY